MSSYFHSVTLDDSLCKGCTSCIKKCPTEAIRVRDGRAFIIEERCIDCGECIRTCVNHAKTALTDDLQKLSHFDYRIAVIPPSFHGLWRSTGESSRASARLLKLGFNAVYEVAIAADIVILAMKRYLEGSQVPRPAISSSCPAVIRLMQVRFPTLLPSLVPFEAPMEIAGGMAKEQAMKETGLPRERIGAFFLTPCPAKVTAIKQPVGRDQSNLDGAIAISTISAALARQSRVSVAPLAIGATESGLLWGRTGGEARSVAQKRGTTIAVDGIHSVIEVLDEVERGRLSDVAFIEAQACVGGCMGGCLTSQNPFVGRVRLNGVAEAFGSLEPEYTPQVMDELLGHGDLRFTRPIEPRPVMKLDADLGRALEMMKALERTLEKLPGLDCGACGCPNCRALAEDIVRGHAFPEDCTFLLRERVRELAEEMVDLAKRVPPAMGEQGQRKINDGGGHGDSH